MVALPADKEYKYKNKYKYKYKSLTQVWLSTDNKGGNSQASKSPSKYQGF